MRNLSPDYSDGAKLHAWNSLLQTKDTVGLPKERVNLFVGCFTPDPASQGYMTERVGFITYAHPPRHIAHEHYDLMAFGLMGSNVPSLRATEDKEPISISEMVNLIKEVFGLSVVQIADILGVSRPSLYNHISGKESPKDPSSYEELFTTALRVSKSVKGSLKPGLKSIFVEGKSLLGHLKDFYKDEEHIERVSVLIAEKLETLNKGSSPIPLDRQRKAALEVGKSG